VNLTLGVNIASRDEIRGNVHPFFHPPGVNTLYCFEEWRGEQRISPPGYNFTPGGQSALLGDNFAPGGQLRSWGTTSLLGDKVCPLGRSLEWASVIYLHSKEMLEKSGRLVRSQRVQQDPQHAGQQTLRVVGMRDDLEEKQLIPSVRFRVTRLGELPIGRLLTCAGSFFEN
jgi:hypothetical protein